MKKLLKRFRRINYREKEARIRKTVLRRTPVIHHYCPHTFNAGDHFVTLSIRKHLRKCLPEAVFIPKSIAVNRGWGAPHRLRGENIAFSNQYADAVIVGGSDNYRNWSLRIDGREIQKLQPPLFLVGLGISSNDLDEPPLIENQKYLEDIRKTHEKTRISTVRDEATLTFLEQLGVTGVILTGCPALYLGDASEIRLKKTGKIILTFPFPVNRIRLSERYRLLEQTIQGLIQHYGADQIIISCHDDRDVPAASERFPGQQIFFSTDAWEYLDLYRQAAFVAGSRLHASILAAGLGIPFLNINVDIRGQSFSSTFGLKSWNLDYTEPDLTARIIQRIDTVMSGDLSAYRSFSKLKSEYGKTFDQAIRAIALIIQKETGYPEIQ
jgi:hypothetical protein